MAAKPSFRRSLFAALAALTAVLAFGASSALAATGSVYFDVNDNVAAGHGPLQRNASPADSSTSGWATSSRCRYLDQLAATTARSVSIRWSTRRRLPASRDRARCARVRTPPATTTSRPATQALVRTPPAATTSPAASQALFVKHDRAATTRASGLPTRSDRQYHRQLQNDRHRLLARSSRTRPATTTSPPATLGPRLERRRERQHRKRHRGARSTTPREATTSPPASSHSVSTQPGTRTSPSERTRSRTPPATPTSRLGFGAGQNLTTGSNNIDIANDGKAGEQKVIRIGTKGDQIRTFIAGISGRTVSGTAQPVVVNAQGQLGTASAAARRSTASLEATVERLQRQVERLREQVKGG